MRVFRVGDVGVVFGGGGEVAAEGGVAGCCGGEEGVEGAEVGHLWEEIWVGGCLEESESREGTVRWWSIRVGRC